MYERYILQIEWVKTAICSHWRVQKIRAGYGYGYGVAIANSIIHTEVQEWITRIIQLGY